MSRTLAIVGAGRVGRSLGQRLRKLGWRIGAVVTRSLATSRAAVQAIGAGTAAAAVGKSVLAADVVFVAVPDRAIRDVARELARLGNWKGKVVLHTSGVLGREALTALARRGASTGSLHPMQTFSGRRAPQLKGVVFGIEAQSEALGMAQQIARALGGVPVRISAPRKPAYHTAGGFAAQHVLAVLEAGTRILMSAGFTRKQATQALFTMARQIMENVERDGPRAAWTGPVARGDFETVAKHIRVLANFPPEVGAAYNALSRLAVRLLAREPQAILRALDRVFGRRR